MHHSLGLGFHSLHLLLNLNLLCCSNDTKSTQRLQVGKLVLLILSLIFYRQQKREQKVLSFVNKKLSLIFYRQQKPEQKVLSFVNKKLSLFLVY
jgi:hypothetical protein